MVKKLLFLLTLAALAVLKSTVCSLQFKMSSFLQNQEDVLQRVRKQVPELFMGPVELAGAAGLAVETHRVRAADGYLLSLHRLAPAPGPAPRGAPLLMVHGLLCAADLFLLTPRRHALAFQLADRGFDVWLANLRGNKYSLAHEEMTPSNVSFWNFSWHEMGAFDVPAFVDYILEKTGQRQLFYVGHSMGNTAYYVMQSTMPEYNDKVRLHVGLAPATYLTHARIAAVHALARFANPVSRALFSARTPELLPASAKRNALLHLLCTRDAAARALCRQALEQLFGPFHPGLNETRLSIYLVHQLQSSSIRTPAHFGQIIASGHFRQWDEGSAESNMARYGRANPPDYDLQRVTAPSAIFYADEDFAVQPKDVLRLAKEQKNVVLLFRVPAKPYNHLDFLYNPSAADIIYQPIFDLLDKF